MAKKKSIDKNIEEIRDALKKNNLIIGTDKTIKMLKLGRIEKVFLTTNAPKDIKQDIEQYVNLNKAKLLQLDIPNHELGIVCKKQFAISVVSIPKGA